MRDFDVVVVGGGIIGLASAWRAAEHGLTVCVAEKASATAGASGVAAGMLAPITEATYGEDRMLALNMAGAGMFGPFMAELSAAAGADFDPGPPGTLFVALDGDQASELGRLFEFQEAVGLDVSWLGAAECRALEPALSPSTRAGVLAAGEGAVDPRAVCSALVEALRRAGGTLIEGAEVATAGSDGVVLAGGEAIGARHTVLAAGCWSGAIDGAPPEVAGALRPVKGQILRLRPRRGEPALLRHIVRTEDVYCVPRAGGEVVVGATVEEQGFDTSLTAGGVFELLRAASETVPGIRELEISEASAGLRPATPDNEPLIGFTSVEGIMAATGHYRNGVLLAPLTAEAIAQGLVTGEMPEWLQDFSPLRFAAAAGSGSRP